MAFPDACKVDTGVLPDQVAHELLVAVSRASEAPMPVSPEEQRSWLGFAARALEYSGQHAYAGASDLVTFTLPKPTTGCLAVLNTPLWAALGHACGVLQAENHAGPCRLP